MRHCVDTAGEQRGIYTAAAFRWLWCHLYAIGGFARRCEPPSDNLLRLGCLGASAEFRPLVELSTTFLRRSDCPRVRILHLPGTKWGFSRIYNLAQLRRCRTFACIDTLSGLGVGVHRTRCSAATLVSYFPGEYRSFGTLIARINPYRQPASKLFTAQAEPKRHLRNQRKRRFSYITQESIE